jgi:hypothetical protein
VVVGRFRREVAERVTHARRLVGQRLAVARYVDIDYRRDQVAPAGKGPRHIIEAGEWRNPTWRYPGVRQRGLRLGVGDRVRLGVLRHVGPAGQVRGHWAAGTPTPIDDLQGARFVAFPCDANVDLFGESLTDGCWRHVMMTRLASSTP